MKNYLDKSFEDLFGGFIMYSSVLGVDDLYTSLYVDIKSFLVKKSLDLLNNKRPELIFWNLEDNLWISEKNSIFINYEFNYIDEESNSTVLKHILTHEIFHSLSFNNISVESNQFVKKTGLENNLFDFKNKDKEIFLKSSIGRFLNEGITEMLTLDFLETKGFFKKTLNVSGYYKEVCVIKHIMKNIYSDIKLLKLYFFGIDFHIFTEELDLYYKKELVDELFSLKTFYEDMLCKFSSEEELNSYLIDKDKVISQILV